MGQPSTGRVKSIVDWIRIGGKNNKETIDRIEKRLRDYYRHEAHKKLDRSISVYVNGPNNQQVESNR